VFASYDQDEMPPIPRQRWPYSCRGRTYVEEHAMSKIIHRLNRWGHALLRQMPDKPYPSEHPWSQHHDRFRQRG